MTAIDQDTAKFTRIAPLDGLPNLRAAQTWGEFGTGAPWSLKAMVLRLLGGCMVLSSTGLWLVEGAGDDAQLALVRVGLSVVLLFFGLVLMLINDPSGQPSVQFDLRAQKVRVVQKKGNRELLLKQLSFDRVGHVKFTANTLALFQTDGTMVVEVPFADPQSRAMIEHQLAEHLPHAA